MKMKAKGLALPNFKNFIQLQLSKWYGIEIKMEYWITGREQRVEKWTIHIQTTYFFNKNVIKKK